MKKEKRPEAVRSVENVYESYHLLLLLLGNYFLVNDGILLLVLFKTFWDQHLHEIIKQCGENIFSKYSECFGKIMERPITLYHPQVFMENMTFVLSFKL